MIKCSNDPCLSIPDKRCNTLRFLVLFIILRPSEKFPRPRLPLDKMVVGFYLCGNKFQIINQISIPRTLQNTSLFSASHHVPRPSEKLPSLLVLPLDMTLVGFYIWNTLDGI